MGNRLEKHFDFRFGPSYLGGLHPAKTGNWRVFYPVIDMKNCKMCLLCWVFCPDGAIKQEEGKLSIDYDYCKGCGICAHECTNKAITMFRE